jgi:hypothetical protein
MDVSGQFTEFNVPDRSVPTGILHQPFHLMLVLVGTPLFSHRKSNLDQLVCVLILQAEAYEYMADFSETIKVWSSPATGAHLVTLLCFCGTVS